MTKNTRPLAYVDPNYKAPPTHGLEHRRSVIRNSAFLEVESAERARTANGAFTAMGYVGAALVIGAISQSEHTAMLERLDVVAFGESLAALLK